MLTCRRQVLPVVWERPHPHEADALELAGPVQPAGRDPLLAALEMAEPGGEDRHPATLLDELAGELEVARTRGPIRGVRVVIDDPDLATARRAAVSHPANPAGRPPR